MPIVSIDKLYIWKALCQLSWVDEKLTSREDTIRSLFSYLQSDKNAFLKFSKFLKSHLELFGIVDTKQPLTK